jgi:4-hydroxy-tetrahydrodipicolinate synthase
MRLGASGAISVLSNVYPKTTAALYRLCIDENWQEAEQKMQNLRPLIGELFREVNPIPVKYLAHLMGYCGAEYRLPLCPPSAETQKCLADLLDRYSELT